MSEKLYDCLEIRDLKDMLNKTKSMYAGKPAYKLRSTVPGEYKIITHDEVRDMIDYLGTSLISLGLKGKRIALIGENRYEWEVAYLSIVCGTGIVAPLDKLLPEAELASLIERSDAEAIFYSAKYSDAVKRIRENPNNHLKILIPFDDVELSNDMYSFKALIENGKKLLDSGNRDFVDAPIDPEAMNMMLFTSGTTSQSKVVALCHRNFAQNLMDIANVLDVNSDDVFLSVLPIHHVFECTVGFLFSLYKGATTVFSEGILHIIDNLKEYHATIMANVPGVYERLRIFIMKQLEKQGKLEELYALEEKYKDLPPLEKKQYFGMVHELVGGSIKLFISGAAALNPEIEARYRLAGFNLVQGYGLTETSPVVAVGTNKNSRIGSIGLVLPRQEVKLDNVNSDGIGELLIKGPNVMLGYYNNDEANKEAFTDDGFFRTGDLARIDEDGYIFICGRKKSVIVLKNGKNIFPEEMEDLVNKVPCVKENMIYGKQVTDDENEIKIFAELVVDKNEVRAHYNVQTDDEIEDALYKEIIKINRSMPKYKSIRGLYITEKPLIRTTTNKLKRQANLEEINKNEK